MAMPGAGAYNAGFSPFDLQNMQNNANQPYVFSGYWGRPVSADELPNQERAAYGFGANVRPWQETLASLQKSYGNNPDYVSQQMEAMYGQGWGQGAQSGGMQGGGSGGPWGGPGMGGGGASMGGSMSYRSSGMNDPWGYANAAANVLENQYNTMKAHTTQDEMGNQARRGIFSSPVGEHLLNERLTPIDLQYQADRAKLFQNRSDQLYSMSQSGGGGGGGGNPSQGGMGPWNMGGFGSVLPGFYSSPGGRAGSAGAGNNAYNGTGFGLPQGWSASGGPQGYNAWRPQGVPKINGPFGPTGLGDPTV